MAEVARPALGDSQAATMGLCTGLKSIGLSKARSVCVCNEESALSSGINRLFLALWGHDVYDSAPDTAPGLSIAQTGLQTRDVWGQHRGNSKKPL